MQHALFLVQKIYQAGFFLVISLVCLDLLAFFFFPETFFYSIFLATKEQTPLTWLSSVVFLFLALAAFIIYHETKKLFWYFFASTFFFFSIDDAIYLHERIAGYFRDHVVMLQDFPSYIWVLLYLPLLLFSLGTLLLLLWRQADRSGRNWLLAIFLALAAAALLDFFDGFIQGGGMLTHCLSERCYHVTLHIMRLTEETLEVLSIGGLGYWLLRWYCTQDQKFDLMPLERASEEHL